MDKEGIGADNQEVLETLRGVAMRECVSEMSRRVEDRGDGHVLVGGISMEG